MAKDKKSDLENTIQQLQERLQRLESARDANENQSQNYEALSSELQQLKQKYADDLYAERQQTKEWHDRARNWQRDYEQLRLQKGGFGIRSMTAFIIGAFFAGLLICYLLLKLTDQRSAELHRFKHNELFKIELALSQGRSDEAFSIIQNSLKNPEYEHIREDIEMLELAINAIR